MITHRLALAALALGISVALVRLVPIQPTLMPPVAEPASGRPPRSLKEALNLLEDTLPPEILQNMRSLPEEEMTMTYYRDFGMGLRNGWGLWSGESGIAAEFCSMGLPDAEAMSDVILRSLWRRLHSQPLLVEEQVRALKEADARMRADWRAARPDDPELFRPSGCPVRDWVE